jgi:hypothetical protein
MRPTTPRRPRASGALHLKAMTRKATHGGTYYVLRSRLMPGLYKPGIAHNFSQRLRQHGGPNRWDTVATYYLGPLCARGLEVKVLRRFKRCLVNTGGEYLRLSDQELAQLLAIAKAEEDRVSAIGARLAPTFHARRQIEHSARVAARGIEPAPAPAAAIAPLPAIAGRSRGDSWRDFAPGVIGIAGTLAFVAAVIGGPAVAVQIYLWTAIALAGPVVALVVVLWIGQLAWMLLKAAAGKVLP